ncbi:MAG: protein-disulfide reductase DsbD domain-containing protein, partial [Endozoicomonas sp.]
MSAQANLDQFFRDQDNAFLPVEEAFRFSGTVENNKAKISVQVRPGHYLYKHKFRFNPASKGIVTDKATYPTGEFIFDPYYNKNLETFSQDFTIDLPVDYSGTLPELEIGFQGCAKAGLCYPPHKIMIPLVASNTSSETSSKTPTSQV